MSSKQVNVNINNTTVADLMNAVNKNGKKYNLFCSYDNRNYTDPLSDESDDDDKFLSATCLSTVAASAPRSGGTNYTIYAKSLDDMYMPPKKRGFGGRRKSKKSKKSRKSRKSRRSRR
jgi:hypothetical protein